MKITIAMALLGGLVPAQRVADAPKIERSHWVVVATLISRSTGQLLGQSPIAGSEMQLTSDQCRRILNQVEPAPSDPVAVVLTCERVGPPKWSCSRLRKSYAPSCFTCQPPSRARRVCRALHSCLRPLCENQDLAHVDCAPQGKIALDGSRPKSAPGKLTNARLASIATSSATMIPRRLHCSESIGHTPTSTWSSIPRHCNLERPIAAQSRRRHARA